MEFNKIAGAILLTALSAMVVSKIGDILIPEEHFVVHKAGDQPQAPATREPEKEDPPVAQALAQADPKKGEALVKARCGSCHTWEKGGPNRVGPNLYGVVGRDKGSHEGFSYSSAMKGAGGQWTYDDIYHFLKNPQEMVSGTKMVFRLPKWEQRADVIAYLRTQGDSPPPLPKPEPAKTEPDKAAPDKGAPNDAGPGKQPAPDKPADNAPPDNAPENRPAPNNPAAPEQEQQEQ